MRMEGTGYERDDNVSSLKFKTSSSSKKQTKDTIILPFRKSHKKVTEYGDTQCSDGDLPRKERINPFIITKNRKKQQKETYLGLNELNRTLIEMKSVFRHSLSSYLLSKSKPLIRNKRNSSKDDRKSTSISKIETKDGLNSTEASHKYEWKSDEGKMMRGVKGRT